MSVREAILAGDGPLDRHEVDLLLAWMEALCADVVAFGAMAEDKARLEAIAARLAGGGMTRTGDGER